MVGGRQALVEYNIQSLVQALKTPERSSLRDNFDLDKHQNIIKLSM